ncbi:glycosyltransferase family 4 protein [Winogradskyella aurantiaca]|uniref:glycosyltransferase family 4 protein n=1 Tax=Winogradskyella aurantiaca TaxID=2219558 RepID=UPI000E1CD76E|nr:glycosyltransferase family 4 protein [Winogradskyella aurantiaca]
MKKILFITHDTSRTGAPKVLLLFLNWIVVNYPNIYFEIVALRGGGMEGEFKDLKRPYYNFDAEKKLFYGSMVNRILMRLRIFKNDIFRDSFIKNNELDKFDIIYANSVVSIPFAIALKDSNPGSKLVTHIHEFKTVISQKLPNLGDYVDKINRVIVPANSLKQELEDEFEIEKEKIKVIREVSTIRPKTDSHQSNGVFVVGGAGSFSWRKGPHLFIQVARHFLKMYNKNVEFRWYGKLNNAERLTIGEDIRKLGLEESIFFKGEIMEISDHFNQMDIFLLTSREDPFPLVCIEVGMLGKPIICFEKASGTQEIIEEKGGFVVSYLDIEEMAMRINQYMEDKELMTSHGEYNRKEFSKFTPDGICPRYFQVIMELC